jgi:hypothetical protein
MALRVKSFGAEVTADQVCRTKSVSKTHVEHRYINHNVLLAASIITNEAFVIMIASKEDQFALGLLVFHCIVCQFDCIISFRVPS